MEETVWYKLTVRDGGLTRCEKLPGAPTTPPYRDSDWNRILFASADDGCLRIPDEIREIRARAFAGCADLEKVILHPWLEALRAEAFADADLSFVEVPASVTVAEAGVFRDVKEIFLHGRVLLRQPEAFAGMERDQVLRAPDIRIAGLPAESRMAAVKGFAAMLREGAPMDEDVREGNLALLRKQYLHFCQDGEVMAAVIEKRLVPFETVRQLHVRGDFGLSSERMDAYVLGFLLLDISLSAREAMVRNAATGSERPYLLYYRGHSLLHAMPLPAGVDAVDGETFRLADCGPEGLVIPSDTREIREGAFCGRRELEMVQMPERLNRLGWSAFERSGLRSVRIPEGVRILEENAFGGCGQLEEAELPRSMEILGKGAFRDSGLRRVRLPEGLREVGDSAFRGCSRLREVVLPQSVALLGRRAFADCPLLERVEIPDGTRIRYLRDRIFCGCSGLRSVRIPEGVTEIERNVFEGCSRLEDVSLPDGQNVL